jgi:phosphatidate cytidylyltransferase
VKRVLTAVILIPLVVLALFKAPLGLFTLLVLGVALLAAKEYLDIAAATGFRPFRGLSYALVFCIFIFIVCAAGEYKHAGGIPEYAPMTVLVLLVASPFILLVAGMRRDPLSQALPDVASSFLLLPYVGISLASMIVVRGDDPTSALFLLFLMLLVWSGDIAAYYVGRAMGKHKLAPRISPGKTWEGAIASVIGAIVIAVLLFHYLRPVFFALKQIHFFPPTMAPSSFAPPETSVPVAIVIAFAVCVNVAAQFGDLVESMLKRGGGVKDSGTLLPGHGGVLDRIDALLFALPVGCFFYFALLGKYFHSVPNID